MAAVLLRDLGQSQRNRTSPPLCLESSASVPGVVRIEKCNARKSGLGVLVEIHVEVESELTVRRGHETMHAVNDKLNCLLPTGRRRLRLFSPPDWNPRSCQLHPEAVLRYTRVPESQKVL